SGDALGSPGSELARAATAVSNWFGLFTLGAIGSGCAGLARAGLACAGSGVSACCDRSLRGFGSSPLRRAKPITVTTTAAAARPNQTPARPRVFSVLAGRALLFFCLAGVGSRASLSFCALLALSDVLTAGVSTRAAGGWLCALRCPVEATVKLSSWLDKAAAAASNLAMLASLMRLGLSVGSGWL